MVRSSAILTTSADQLVEFVKSREKVTVEETAKTLKTSEKSVHALVDFLVEEKILGIEYKFTTPYIYLSKKGFKEPTFVRKKEEPVLLSKEEFYEKAKSRSIPYQEIGTLWRKYLEKELSHVKKDFYEKAKGKNTPDDKIEELWQKYLSYL